MSAHTAVRIEGGLLSPDLVETITGRQGQKPADFGVDGRRSVLDEATAAWADARLYWKAYQARLARQSGESPVTATREQWAIPLLEALGYHLTYQRRAAEAGERRYALSHRAGEDEAAPPVHIVGYDEELGKRSLPRATQMTPHALLQDYLNRSEHLWGVVTNGYQLRLLRDSSHFSRPAYIEFDLQSMFAGDQLDEFLLLYRLAHRTRLPRGVDDAPQCLLEQYHQDAIEEGGRIREGLREAVETSIQTLANGFLAHRRNEPLRAAVRGGRLSPDALYKELLYLIYRLLFLMVAEERNLLQAGGDGARAAYDTYQRHWSISRLRALAEEPLNAPQRFDDLYLGLRALFTALRSPDMCAPLGLAPLNGELFEPLEYLDAACLNNRDLLDAVREMSFFLPRDERVRRRVNYGALDVEELGSVYEALLDYQPVLDTPPGGAPEFSFTHGTTRKSTGSYYTRPELVKELVESALVPVMEARLREAGAASEARQEALLSLTVCDPACGSGHFLLAAARRIGTELARTRAGDTEPSPEEVRLGVRDAITHCIYGVDRNPLAVDLCKVALWIEGYARGKPLTFLDYRIRCGDSLVGVFDLEVLKAGIPDGAYTAVSGDDKAIARGLRERNARERAGQLPLAADGSRFMVQDVLTARHDLLRLPEDTPDQVTRKRDTLKHLQLSAAWQGLQEACHLWTAAFFAPFTREGAPRVPTTAAVRGCLHGVRAAGSVMGAAVEAATRLRFFHWPLEFPEVLLESGGFDVVLANPPFSAAVTHRAKKAMATLYSLTNTNTAALFSQLIANLCGAEGAFGFVCPKSVAYSSRWADVRGRLIGMLTCVCDCGQAWDEVLLEQVTLAGRRQPDAPLVGVSSFDAQGFHSLGSVPRTQLIRYDLIPSDSEPLMLGVLEKVGEEAVRLGDMCRTKRGLGLQRVLRPEGDVPVLSGQSIGRYRVKGNAGYVSAEDAQAMATVGTLPTVLYQNIVAFVGRPKPHIKVTACVEESAYITLDTVNSLSPIGGTVDSYALCGLLNSRVFNWLAWRLLYSRAVRTMHLDQYHLDRIPVPVEFLDSSAEIGRLSRAIHEGLGQQFEMRDISALLRQIDGLVADAYLISRSQREVVFAEFPDVDL